MSVLRFLLSLCNVSSASKRSGFAARPVHTILLVAMALSLVAPLISGLPTVRAAPLPVPTTLESPLPAPSPEPEVPALSIQITTDPAVVEPGGPFTVTVTVMNRGPEDWSGSLLVSWIGSPLTFSVSVPGGETIEYTQRMVMPPSVELGPVELGVRLLEEGVLAAETTGVIGAASGDAPWAVDAWGGSFHSADGRVRVGFPAGAVDRLVQVSVTSDVMPEGIERGPGQFIRFSLSARDGVGNEIRAFARPVALRIDARGLFPNNVLPSGWQPYLITREGDEGPWTEVPITFEDGFLLAETRHFSEWASGAVAEGWQPVYTPPVANLFSGALTYRFPLQVPPGRSGLQPELGLSYSSRGLDGVITGTNVMESSPVAFGWSIDGLIEVVRDNTHHKWDGAHYRLHMYDQFTLLVGGTGYELEPNTSGQLCGRYQARNAPHLYVERRNEMCQNGSSSTTTDYWVIRLPDGTEAILGDTDSSQAVMSQYYNLLVCHGYCSPQNQTRGAQRYRVRQIQDTFGNEIGFSYREEWVSTYQQDLGGHETSRPSTISYNKVDGTYRSQVKFIGVPGDLQRIEYIEVWHDGGLVRKYELDTDRVWYSGCDHTSGHWALTKIKEIAGDGSVTLTQATFGHVPLPNFIWTHNGEQEECFFFRRINSVRGGMLGGTVEITYESDERQVGPYEPPDDLPDFGLSYRVGEIRTYDGIHPGPSTTTYDYGGMCYDQDTDTGLEPGLMVQCGGRDPSSVGPLVGHNRNTVRVYDYGGELLSSTVHRFRLGDDHAWDLGLEYLVEMRDPSDFDTVLQRTDTEWGYSRNLETIVTYQNVVTTTTTGSGGNLQTIATYQHDSYGNVIREDTVDGEGNLERRLLRLYLNDTDDWIIGKLGREELYDGEGDLLSASLYTYDGNLSPDDGLGNHGLLTLARTRTLSGTETADVAYAHDGYGNVITQTVYATAGSAISSTDIVPLERYPGGWLMSYGSFWFDSLRVTGPSVLSAGDTYHMWHDNYDDYGTWRIGYATSRDGRTWERLSSVVLGTSGCAFCDGGGARGPSVLQEDGSYTMWFSGQSDGVWSIGRARSVDGIDWTTVETITQVLTTAEVDWDLDSFGILNPSVTRDGDGTFWMFFQARESSGDNDFCIGAATSLDGIDWSVQDMKLTAAQLGGSWGQDYLRTPEVIWTGDQFVMWYEGKTLGSDSDIGVATSPDGIAWTPWAGNPVLPQGAENSWEDSVDNPSVVLEDGLFRVWYGGLYAGYAKIGLATAPAILWDGGPAGGPAPDARSTSYEYDATYNIYPVQMTNALGHTVTRVYDPALDVVTQEVDANDQTTKYEYDGLGRLVEVWRPQQQGRLYPSVGYEYHPAAVGSENEIVDPFHLRVLQLRDEATGGMHVSRQWRDGLGREIQQRSWTDNAQMTVMATEYNALDQVTRQSMPYWATNEHVYAYAPVTWNEVSHTSHAYDALGREVLVTDGCGNTTAVTHTVTPTGTWTTVVDANNHRRDSFTDRRGRLARVREYTGTVGGGLALYATTVYTYDERDDLVLVQDALGHTTVITYDGLGRKMAMDDPDMGHWTYNYDLLGNLVSQTDARQNTIVFEYDALNRVLARAHGGQLLASFTYDQGTNSVGRLSRMDDPSGWAEYTYDEHGQQTMEAKHIDGAGTFVTTWYHDPMGRVVATGYPTGETVTFAYENGTIDTVGSYVTGIDHNAAGQPAWLALGNGLVTTRTYRACDGRMTELETFDPATPTVHLQDLSYSYDPVGNVSGATNLALNDLQTFVYDPLDRLIEAAATGNHAYSQSFDYDELGNITARDDSEYTRGDPAHVHATTAVVSGSQRIGSYAYDANGNMRQRVVVSGTKTITYEQTFDVENRLASVAVTTTDSATTTMSVSGVQYVYDGSGARVLEIGPEGLSTAYVGELYEAELGPSDPVSASFESGALAGWWEVSGTWQVQDGIYYGDGAPALASGDVLFVEGGITVTVDGPKAYVVFDLLDADDYRFAGRRYAPMGQWVWELGEVDGGQETVVASYTTSIGSDAEILTVLRAGSVVSLPVDATTTITYDFGSPPGGTVGLRADEACDFEDLEIDAAGTWQRFQGRLGTWEPIMGSWQVEEGQLSGQQRQTDGIILAPEGLAEGRIVARMASQSWGGDENGAIVFDYQDVDNYRFVQMDTGWNRWVIGERSDGTVSELAAKAETIQNGTAYTVEVVLTGGQMTLLVDGEAKLAYDFGSRITDTVGLQVHDAHTYFDDVRLLRMAEVPASILAEGLPDGWEVVSGTWQLEDGVLSGQQVDDVALILAPPWIDLDNGRIVARMASQSWEGAENGAIVFDYQDAENHRFAQMRAGADQWAFGVRAAGVVTHLAQVAATIDDGVFYDVEVVLREGQARLLVDGEYALAYDYGAPFASSRAGLSFNSAHTHVDVWEATPMSPTAGLTFTFPTTSAAGWEVVAGTWSVESGEYRGEGNGSQGLSVVSPTVDFSAGWLRATMRTKSWSGHSQNGFLVWDYEDADNFYFAGMAEGADKWQIRQMESGNAQVLAELSESISTDVPYEVEVIVRAGEVVLAAEGEHKLAYDLGEAVGGTVGLRVNDARTHFDAVTVMPLEPQATVSEAFEGALEGWTIVSGTWQADGEIMSGQAQEEWGILLAPEGLTEGRLQAVMTSQSWEAATNGAIVFDYQDAENYRFAQMRAGADQWALGQCVNGEVSHPVTKTATIDTETPYEVVVVLQDGGRAALLVDGMAVLSYTYDSAFTQATVGLGVGDAHTHFEDVAFGDWEAWEAEATQVAEPFDRWDLPTAWEALRGLWWSDGELVGEAGAANAALAVQAGGWLEGAITATVTVSSGSAARVILGVVDGENYRYAELDAGEGWRIGQVKAGVDAVASESAECPPSAGQAYVVEVEVEGGRVSLHAGGVERVSHDFGGLGAVGSVGVGVAAGQARFDEVRLATELALQTERTYYYAGSQRVAMRENDGVYYLHANHLGSMSLVTDEDGQVAARRLYEPFGEVRWSEGALPTDYGFTGQALDANTGLMYYGARWYDPVLGRWISADTIVPDPTNPQGLVRYSYVLGNPLKYTDPTGHIEETEYRDALDIINNLRQYGVYIDVDFGYFPITHPAPGESTVIWEAGVWEFPELELVQQAVMDLGAKISAELGNGLTDAENYGVVGPVCMRRIHGRDLGHYLVEARTGVYAGALTLFNTVKLYDGVFDQSDAGVRMAIVHETAHAWDWGAWASLFIETFVGNERNPTEWGETNPQEHWAETVTSWVYPALPQRGGRDLGPVHQLYLGLVVGADAP